jgi:DNA-directed RNA polymerase subunit RPC12/RpoP
MFKKKIKVQIPKTHKCSNCGQQARLDDIDEYFITHDNVCVVAYQCKCGHHAIIKQSVKFI